MGFQGKKRESPQIGTALARFALCLLLLGAALAVRASCTLTVTAAGPCDSNGNHVTPHLGDTYYGVYVNWTATGTPAAQYTVSFSLGPNSYVWNGNTSSPGNYSVYVRYTMPVDGSIPYTVVVDPGGVSGDSNTAAHTASGSYSPIGPSSPYVWYGQQTITATQTMDLNVQSDSNITTLYAIFGQPTNGTSQQVTSYTPAAGAVSTPSSPTNYPTSIVTLSNPPNQDYKFTQSMSTQASSYMANQSQVDFTWSSLSSLPSDIAQFQQPDSVCESNDPAIQSYVASVLPANYQTTLSPLQAARELFQAVAAKINYQTPASNDALTTLNNGDGDCASMSDLYVACLRSIGMAARTVCGFTTVEDHCWTELYSPTVGWIPQDVTYCNTACKGAYAYYFMVMPDLHNNVITCRGEDFTVEGYDFSSLQYGGYLVYGQWDIFFNTSYSISTSPAESLANFYTSAGSVVGGTGLRGVVQIPATAPTGGMVVSLSSGNSALTVPASVTVPAGSTGVSFAIQTSVVPSPQSVTVTAQLGASSKQAVVVVNPYPVSNFYLLPATVEGGVGTRGVVQISQKAGSGGVVVNIQSGNSAAMVPGSVTVPAGTTGVSFAISTLPVSASAGVTLTASSSGAGKTTTLTLNPYPLSNFYAAPSSIKGGTTTHGVVQLAGKAGPGGDVVSLSSSDSHAQVPATVTVPAGSTGVSFAITTSGVATTTQVTLTATFGGSSKQTMVILTP